MATRSRRRSTKAKNASASTSTSASARASALSTPAPEQLFLGDPLGQTPDQDKKRWKGFCEIDSDPACFTAMLKNFGVRDIKVQEVFSLEEEMLDMIPSPTHGLIFLFRFKEDDPDKQEQFSPPGVWFANQTSPNACATVALLNIVNNVPELDLGDNLAAFKAFTYDFPPHLRGNAIGNFEFVRQVHNSFARKMDMLNEDLSLKNYATAPKTGKNRPNSTIVSDEPAGFHFIAFVPIEGHLWKLDGLERAPMRLGKIKEGRNWLPMATSEIEERIKTEDSLEYTLLAVCQDPLVKLRVDLASNVHAINKLDAALQSGYAGVQEIYENGDEATLLGPSEAFLLGTDTINKADISPRIIEVLQIGEVNIMEEARAELASDQTSIRHQIRDEMMTSQMDEQNVLSRQIDHGPLIRKWLRFLARKGALKPLVEALDT